jgi:hypothetical protein
MGMEDSLTIIVSREEGCDRVTDEPLNERSTSLSLMSEAITLEMEADSARCLLSIVIAKMVWILDKLLEQVRKIKTFPRRRLSCVLILPTRQSNFYIYPLVLSLCA